MQSIRFLVIDDHDMRLEQLESALRFAEYEVVATKNIKSIRADSQFDVILVGSGIVKQQIIMNTLVRYFPLVIKVMVSDAGLHQLGFYGQEEHIHSKVEWPMNNTQFKDFVTALPIDANATPAPLRKGLSGVTEKISDVMDMIRKVGKTSATVLLLGESGTGKEVAARSIHYESDRSDMPFIAVNCGAIPGDLLESELFGHEKGAFTGAVSARSGRFELAEGGTLFLDEIGDMPMAMQVKLLRVLQERCYERIGGVKTVSCNVRIIAATHRDLEKEIKGGRFREDLFYRLNVFPIEMPALRERIEDLPYIVDDLLARMAVDGRGVISFDDRALTAMMKYEWPGNIRELSNFLERMAILHPNQFIDFALLPDKFRKYNVPTDVKLERKMPDRQVKTYFERLKITDNSMIMLPKAGMDLKQFMDEIEWSLIKQALTETNGVVAHAARLLNMRRTTLVEKMRSERRCAT